MSALLEILFIGHSLVSPTLPAMVEEALKQGNHPAHAEAQIINGAPLRWNWEHSASAQGVDARALLPKGRHDVVVMTEAIPLDNHVTWSDSHGAAQAFYELAVTANPQAQVFLYETWHTLRSGPGVTIEHDTMAHIPWRERLEQDHEVWQGIVDHVNAARPSGALPMRLLPAGQALGRLHDAIEAGEIAGLDTIEALFSDEIHPGPLGWYFISMVHYAAITGNSPEGLPAGFTTAHLDTTPRDLAAQFQRVAWETVAPTLPADMPALPTGAGQGSAPEDASGTGTKAKPGTDSGAKPGAERETAPDAATDVLPSAPALDDASAPQQKPRPKAARARAQDSRPALAFGLTGVADYSTQLPFLDLMKQARIWDGHLPGRWAGRSYQELRDAGVFDSQGWPTRVPDDLESIGAVLIADLPSDDTASEGRYVLRYRGSGNIELRGRMRLLSRQPGEIRFHHAPGPGILVLHIRATDPAGTGDHIRDITVVREDQLERHEAGEIFNPRWLERLGQPEAVRFMDWMRTNNSALSRWDERPRPEDHSWGLNGVPLEVMLALANQVGVDPWFTLPHLADDDFIRRFAMAVRDGLDPERKAYVELSNEVWNWQFGQAHWANEAARDRWGRDNGWVQYYAKRATEMAQIWDEVFGDAARDRLVRVITTQTGWLGLEEMILHAPFWIAQDPTLSAPYENFDAYAVAGYFGSMLGQDSHVPKLQDWIAQSESEAMRTADALDLQGPARAGHIAAHRFDRATAVAALEVRDGSIAGGYEGSLAHFLQELLPHHAKVAAAHDLDLIMYEGGTHVVGVGDWTADETLTAFFTHFNYTAEMGALYDTLLEGWVAAGGGLFNAFVDVDAPSRWGSWGHLRHLEDDNPRWQALMRFAP